MERIIGLWNLVAENETNLNKRHEMQFIRDVDQHMAVLSHVEILAFLIELDGETEQININLIGK